MTDTSRRIPAPAPLWPHVAAVLLGLALSFVVFVALVAVAASSAFGG